MSKNRLLSIVISVVMVAAMMPAMAFADDGFLGTGTQDDPYKITSETDLNTLRTGIQSGNNYSGKYFRVTDSFSTSSSWNGARGSLSVGQTSNYSPTVSGTGFAGTFDGNGKTITISANTGSNSVAGGLFAYVEAAGTVKNITVAGTLTGSGSDAVGGVVGYNKGSISSVESKVVVTATSTYNVGGIAGFNTGAIDLSRNIGSVTGLKKVGGITGENAGTITKCFNSGNVRGTDASKNGVGGIAGRAGDNNTATETSTITDCFNRGAITCTNGKWVGGITGFLNTKSTCSNCYNVGSIYGSSYRDHIAGNKEGTVTNCYGLSTATGAQKYDGATVVSTDQLSGKGTVKDGKNILELLNGTGSVWAQKEGAYPYIAGNTMDDVYSFSFTGPTKTAYAAGENFSTDGLVITATPADDDAGTVTYSIIDGNNLSASTESVIASGTYNGVYFALSIPITVTGENTVTVGTGGTYSDLDTAFRHVNKNGKIEVMSKLTVSATSDLTYNKKVTIKRGAAFTGEMFEIAAGTNTVTFTTMTIDGTYTSGSNADTLFKVTSGTLRLRGGVTLSNCGVAVDVCADTDSTAKLVVNKAAIGGTTSVKLENTSSLFTFENYSGATSSITGKVYLATDTYIEVGAALPCSILLDMETISDFPVVAAGTTGYTLQRADKLKITTVSGDPVELEEDTNTIYVNVG